MVGGTDWVAITDGFAELVKGYYDRKVQEVKIPTQKILFERLESSEKGRCFLESIDSARYKRMLFGDANVPGYEDIDRNVMLAQIALMEDTAWVVYKKNEDDEDLEVVQVTAQRSIIEGCGQDWGTVAKAIVKKNREGFLKAYRIDVEYGHNGVEESMKIVNPRKFDIDDIKGRENTRFTIIPGVVFREFANSILNRMKTGKVYRMSIISGDNAVFRFTTGNPEILAKYCDNPEMARLVSPRYVSNSGVIYVPELGAPSVSSMLTRIDLFNLWRISESTAKAAEREGVHKPENVLRNVLAEEVLKGKLMQQKYHDNDAYSNFMYHLNPGAKLLDKEDATPASLSKFLHTLTEAEKERVFNLAGVMPQVQKVMRFFIQDHFCELSEYLQLSPEDRVQYSMDLTSFLKSTKDKWYNVPLIKLQYYKKDGSIGSMLVSNDQDVLMEVYGEDYAQRYESFNSKFKSVESSFMLFVTGTFERAKSRVSYMMRMNGLSYSDDMFKEIEEFAETCRLNKDEEIYMLNVKRIVALQNNISLIASEASTRTVKANAEKRDTYLFRTLCGYITENGKPDEYFKSLDLNKIKAVFVVY